MQAQKGPRAYIVFSYGKAIAVVNMAKDARAEVKRLKARQIDAVYCRFPSRLAAEEFAAWHNYQAPLNTTG